MLRTRNNTDGNKLVIFSGTASSYGDNYIIITQKLNMFYTPIYHGVAQDYCTGMISGKGWDEMYSIVLVVLFETSFILLTSGNIINVPTLF